MTRDRLTLLLLVLMTGNCLASDDWIGLDEEPGLVLGADIAVDDQGDLTAGLNLELPIGASAGFDGSYRVSELSDDEGDLQHKALLGALWFQLSERVDIELNYFFEGDFDEIEKETLGVALGFTHGNWRFQLQTEEGELHLFTRSDLNDLINREIPDRFASDVDGYSLSIIWQQQNWYWQAIHQRFDYERDLSGLGRSSIVQFVIRPDALAQSSLLISEYSAVLIGFTNTANDYSLQLAQDQSAIDDIYTDTLMISWQHWSSTYFAYLLETSFVEPDDARLVVGIRWLM